MTIPTALEKLQRTGVRLFGARWKTPMADRLGVTGRTVRNWTTGRTPVPPWVEAECDVVVAEEAADTRARLRELLGSVEEIREILEEEDV